MPNNAPNPKSALPLLRFEVICHLKNLRQEGIPLAECLRSASSRPWPEPDGNYYSARTLETWWYDYAKSGYGGLAGKDSRADAGKSRSIDKDTGEWILMKIQQNPRTPLQVLHRHWQQHGHGLPSISSVYRFLKAHGYDRRTLNAGRLDSGPQKAFEAPAPNDLWMVDFATGPTLRTPEGKALTTQLCVILDDHSRLITHAAYYPTGDTITFLASLKQAALRRGLPHKLYTDQGKPFVSHHTRTVCAILGIRLLHAKPYHAWSKGKVERLIRTIQGDFEATLRLEGEHVHSLPDLNTALSRWIETFYHLRIHSSTGMSPHQRFTGGAHPLRQVEEPDKIDPFFYTRSERVVRKDGTVTLGKTLYEVHLSLRALKIELRYDPLLLDRVEVWHKGSFHGLATKADLHLNSQTYNRSHNYERPTHS
jgi:transposase InsO family protein